MPELWPVGPTPGAEAPQFASRGWHRGSGGPWFYRADRGAAAIGSATVVRGAANVARQASASRASTSTADGSRQQRRRHGHPPGRTAPTDRRDGRPRRPRAPQPARFDDSRLTVARSLSSPYMVGASGRTRIVTINPTVPNIRTDRAAETRDFFTELLGFEVVMDLGWVVTVASRTNRSAQVTIVSNDDPAAPGISVEVDDVDAVHARGGGAGPRDRLSPCATRSGASDASCFASRAARS